MISFQWQKHSSLSLGQAVEWSTHPQGQCSPCDVAVSPEGGGMVVGVLPVLLQL